MEIPGKTGVGKVEGRGVVTGMTGSAVGERTSKAG